MRRPAPALHIRKYADLEGEDMLQFLSGGDLFSYCGNCAHSAFTPITGVLACTKGDDPEVRDYSERLNTGETDDKVEQCPQFTPGEDAAGSAAPREAFPSDSIYVESSISADAAMIKEIPSSIVNAPEEFQDQLDAVLENLEPEEKLQAEMAIAELLMDDRISRQGEGDISQEDYGYEDRDGRKQDILGVKQASEVSRPDEKEAFYSYLRESGLTSDMDPTIAKQIVTQAILTWRDGLLSIQTSPEVIDQVWEDFRGQ